MRIAVLALEGVFDTGLTVTLDALRIANSLSTAQKNKPPFDGRGVRELRADLL